MAGFRRTPRGVSARFTSAQAGIVRNLVSQVAELVGGPEAAGDFRRYTEPGLRSGKVEAARTVLATLPDEGGRIRLSAGDAEAWLRALNDVRLALGVLLGITEDYERELADVTGTDPRSAYLQVYDWLTFLQETLVRSLR